MSLFARLSLGCCRRRLRLRGASGKGGSFCAANASWYGRRDARRRATLSRSSDDSASACSTDAAPAASSSPSAYAINVLSSGFMDEEETQVGPDRPFVSVTSPTGRSC
ncbi:hypothetical protein [Burkholderia gladioli]|uniref:hypothetical protein n=1 Tax=Burkholderia gladioli TaxID=28095 RepID=UPI001FC82E54|nr:hypothetical protein [Burkholderia gladioli]